MQVIHSLGGVMVIKKDIDETTETDEMVVSNPKEHVVNTCFPVYNRLDKQLRYKKYYHADLARLFAPNDRFLPFQILREASGRAIATFNLKNVDTGASTSYLTHFNANKEIEELSTIGYDYIMYKGDVGFSPALSNGTYYLEIGDGEYTWYSEVFEVCSNVINNTTVDIYGGSGDGRVYHEDSAWDDVKDAATGTSASTADATANVQSLLDSGTYKIQRLFIYPDLSSIDDDVELLNATLKVYAETDNGAEIYVVKGTQEDSLTTADYDAQGSTSFGSISSVTLNQYNDITLNSDGIEELKSKLGGTAKLCLMTGLDFGDVAPTDTTKKTTIGMQDNGTQGKRPKIELVYSDYDDVVKVEFWDDIDLGDIRYKYGSDLWHQQVFLKTEIKSEDIRKIREMSERDGEDVIERVVMQDVYRMRFIVPVYLVRALKNLPAHDHIQITDKNGEVIEPKNVEVGEPENIGGGAFARMSIEFIKNSVVKKNTNINMT